MRPHFRSAVSSEEWLAWRRIARQFTPYRLGLCGVAGLEIVWVILSMVSPLLLQRVIDQALPRHNTALLVFLCSAMIVSGMLTSAIAVGVSAMTNSIGQGVVHRLRLDVYDRVQRMPLDFFTAESNSEIQARMASDIGGISDIVTYSAQTALSGVTGLLTAALVMLILSWPLALASLALGFGLNLLNLRFNAKRRKLAGMRQERVGAMLKVVSEDLALPGVILGRTLWGYGRQRSRFTDTSRQISDITYQQRLAGSTARAAIGMTMACLPPIIYLLSGTAFRGLSLGTVVVLAAMQTRLSMPIQQLLNLSGNLQSAMVMFGRAFAYLDLAPDLVLPDDVAQKHAVDSHVRLRARGIWHAYPNSDRMVLADIDLDVTPGSTTLIFGHTGSGKSTLALILAGLLTPAGGSLEVNGESASSSTLWRNVTLVSQETAMFNTSVRENLLFAKPNASAAELSAVIAAAELETLMNALPEGLDTIIGERGYQLSGGERQRIAIARAMLAPNAVLITDEATSALDRVTADAIHQAIRRHCRSTALIVIAHRAPAITEGDHIIVLEQGHVAERGSHEALLRSGVQYQRLIHAHGHSAAPGDSRSLTQPRAGV